MFSNGLLCTLIHPSHCFVSEIMASVLLLAHKVQEMPEWERWEISREKEHERNMSSETLSPMCYFDRILPVPEDSFLVSFVGSGSWSSSLAETPASTHTSIWPFSHSEVQSGGNKSFFPLRGIQHDHSAQACSL